MLLELEEDEEVEEELLWEGEDEVELNFVEESDEELELLCRTVLVRVVVTLEDEE